MDGFVPIDTYNKLYENYNLLRQNFKKVSDERSWWREQCLEFHKDYCVIVQKLEEMKDRMDLVADKW